MSPSCMGLHYTHVLIPKLFTNYFSCHIYAYVVRYTNTIEVQVLNFKP